MSLHDYLPSKKIRIILICIICAGIVFLGFKYVPSIKKVSIFTKGNMVKNTEQVSKIGDIVGKDTDTDGVADWEELIRGTDPKKTDSDEDGVSDLVEINQQKSEESGENEKIVDTETSVFAKQLFTTIASLQESGTLNEDSASKIVNQASLTAQKNQQEIFYREDQLNIVPNLSNTSFKGNTEKILVKYKVTYESLQKVFLILKTIPENGEVEGTSIVADLSAISNNFKQAIVELLKNPVPAKSASVYIDFINAFQYVSENVSDIGLIDQNPLVSFSAITTYPQNVSVFLEKATILGKRYRE